MIAIRSVPLVLSSTVLLASACAIACALLMALASSAEARSFKTSTSFGYYEGARSASDDAFLGQVDSPKAACAKRRKVTVFRKRGRRVTRYGSDRTGRTGQWTVEQGRIRPGRYFAKVRKKRLGRGTVCRAFRTTKIPVTR